MTLEINIQDLTDDGIADFVKRIGKTAEKYDTQYLAQLALLRVNIRVVAKSTDDQGDAMIEGGDTVSDRLSQMADEIGTLMAAVERYLA